MVRNGRFVLRETSIKDENTSDNEIPVMMRSLNASLTADVADVDNFTLLPLCRVNWTVINSSQPSLRLDDNYMPPFITVSDDCPLLSMCSESLFQMRSARNSLTTALADEGYDPSAVTPRSDEDEEQPSIDSTADTASTKDSINRPFTIKVFILINM